MANPPAPSSANSYVGPYAANRIWNPGDIVTSDGVNGWWVCKRYHPGGSVIPFPITPGQSTDTWQWSVGPSLAGV